MTTDTELRLTEAERETLRGLGQGQYVAAVERIIVDRVERAEAEVARLREGIQALIAEPDDTQWWEVVPYMDPPEQDEVVEVAVVATDRLRSLLQEGE